MSRIIVKPGNVYSIPLEDGRYGYAQALESPEFAFFNIATETELSAKEVISYPLMFRIWVHKLAVKTWNKIGQAPVNEPLSKQVPRFKQNALNGKISIYINEKETPASIEEVQGLECAAVWEGPHIISRICDHLAGQENIWVVSMQPKKRVNKARLRTALQAAATGGVKWPYEIHRPNHTDIHIHTGHIFAIWWFYM